MKKYLIFLFISAFIIFSFVLTISSADAAKKHSRKKHAAKHNSGTPRLKTVSKNPYLGAIVIDAATDEVLFEDYADAKGYPASMTKMMTFLLILEAVEAKQISLQDRITISPEVAKIGGSQVYLRANEVHTVNDLLYALIIKSANDAAGALAIHYAGSKEAFVRLMNKRARNLGMNDTVFSSVHGLPPDKKGQLPDISTPRDITRLCLELLKHPDALEYTSTKQRLFRTDTKRPMVMRNHNRLVENFEGCDGLKTGYFRAAGFSIAATATKNGARAIVVIFGSADRNVRDANARKLLSNSLMKIAENAPSRAVALNRGTETSVLNWDLN